MMVKYATLGTRENAAIALGRGDEDDAKILDAIARRKFLLNSEMKRFQEMCDRFDNLYYANVFTKGGADHWPEDPNMSIPGKSHVSVNLHPTYVDVPAALQAVTPIENITPGADAPELRD